MFSTRLRIVSQDERSGELSVYHVTDNPEMHEQAAMEAKKCCIGFALEKWDESWERYYEYGRITSRINMENSQ